MFYFCWGGRRERNSHFSLRVGESGSCHPSLIERGDGEYSEHLLRMHHTHYPNHWGLVSCSWGAPRSLRKCWGWEQWVTCESASARNITPVSKWVFVWVAWCQAYIRAAFSRKERTYNPLQVSGLICICFLMETPFHGVILVCVTKHPHLGQLQHLLLSLVLPSSSEANCLETA